jgi:6-pyruvoyl-tetrahydropterin synthase
MQKQFINEIKNSRMKMESQLIDDLVDSLKDRFYTIKKITDKNLQIAGHDLHAWVTNKRNSKLVFDAKFHCYDSPVLVWETKDSAYTNHTWTNDTEIDYLIWVTLYNKTGYFIDFKHLKKNWISYAYNLDDKITSDTGGEFYMLDLNSIVESQPQVPILAPFTFKTTANITIKQDKIHKAYY